MSRFKKRMSIEMTAEQLGLLLNGKTDAEGDSLQATISFLYGQEEVGVSGGIGVIKPGAEYVIEVKIVPVNKFFKER